MMTNCSEYCVLLEEVWIPAVYMNYATQRVVCRGY